MRYVAEEWKVDSSAKGFKSVAAVSSSVFSSATKRGLSVDCISVPTRSTAGVSEVDGNVGSTSMRRPE